jgi:hypothetical protein
MQDVVRIRQRLCFARHVLQRTLHGSQQRVHMYDGGRRRSVMAGDTPRRRDGETSTASPRKYDFEVVSQETPAEAERSDARHGFFGFTLSSTSIRFSTSLGRVTSSWRFDFAERALCACPRAGRALVSGLHAKPRRDLVAEREENDRSFGEHLGHVGLPTTVDGIPR